MRNISIVFVFLLAVLGCNLSNLKQNSNTLDPTRPTPSPFSSIPSPSPSASPTPTPKPAIGSVLKKSVGKYPYEIKLLDMPDLKARLQKLMGKDFAAMKQFWNVETPIEISGKVLKTSGCEQHNCGPNLYVLFIDIDKDNINVYHLGDRHNTYFEKGKIVLPPGFQADIDAQSQDEDQ